MKFNKNHLADYRTKTLEKYKFFLPLLLELLTSHIFVFLRLYQILMLYSKNDFAMFRIKNDRTHCLGHGL